MRIAQRTTPFHFPVVDVGMYDSLICIDERMDCDDNYIVESSNYLSETEKEYYFNHVWDAIDYQQYKKDIADTAIKYVKEFFADISDKVKVDIVDGSQKIWSPPYYNFQTDELDFEIDIEQSEIDKIIKAIDGNDEFFEFIDERYGSWDGFCSFMPHRKDEYIEAINGGRKLDFALLMYFGYLLFNDDDMWHDNKKRATHYHESFVDDVMENMYPTEYFTDEHGDKLMAILHKADGEDGWDEELKDLQILERVEV